MQPFNKSRLRTELIFPSLLSFTNNTHSSDASSQIAPATNTIAGSPFSLFLDQAELQPLKTPDNLGAKNFTAELPEQEAVLFKRNFEFSKHRPIQTTLTSDSPTLSSSEVEVTTPELNNQPTPKNLKLGENIAFFNPIHTASDQKINTGQAESQLPSSIEPSDTTLKELKLNTVTAELPTHAKPLAHSPDSSTQPLNNTSLPASTLPASANHTVPTATLLEAHHSVTQEAANQSHRVGNHNPGSVHIDNQNVEIPPTSTSSYQKINTLPQRNTLREANVDDSLVASSQKTTQKLGTNSIPLKTETNLPGQLTRQQPNETNLATNQLDKSQSIAKAQPELNSSSNDATELRQPKTNNTNTRQSSAEYFPAQTGLKNGEVKSQTTIPTQASNTGQTSLRVGIQQTSDEKSKIAKEHTRLQTTSANERTGFADAPTAVSARPSNSNPVSTGLPSVLLTTTASPDASVRVDSESVTSTERLPTERMNTRKAVAQDVVLPSDTNAAPSIVGNSNSLNFLPTDAIKVPIIHQLSQAIQNHLSQPISESESNTFTIRLDPPELGRITVDFEKGKEGLKIAIFVENQLVRQAVDFDLRSLISNLEKAEVQLDSVDVSSDRDRYRDDDRNETPKTVTQSTDLEADQLAQQLTVPQSDSRIDIRA